MSGHSKWATIKRAKQATDAKKGQVFTKLAKNIALAAKAGKDPSMNSALRAAIDAGREANMPKANIEKAILRGAGELPGQQLEEAIYEAYGPSGVAIIIETISDNKNRTASSLKSTLAKYGGRLGGQNSVSYLFSKKGVIRIENTNEETQLKAIDAGALDVLEEEGGLTVYTSPQDFEKIRKKLEKTEYAQIEMVPQNKIALSDESAKNKFQSLLEELEQNDDINNIYSNADL